MAFPNNPNGMMAGMNPTAGMSEQEVQMTKMVRQHRFSERAQTQAPTASAQKHAPRRRSTCSYS